MIETVKLVPMLILFGCAASPASWSIAGQTPADQDSEWTHVLQLEDRASDLKKRESADPTLHVQRVQAFAAAAQALLSYASKHAADPKHLSLTYRLAVDLELSEQWQPALASYEACAADTAYYHTVEIDGQKLDSLVPDRIGQVIKQLTCEPVNGTVTCWILKPGNSSGLGPGQFAIQVLTSNVTGMTIDDKETSFHTLGHDIGGLQINKEALRTMISRNGITGGQGPH
jgi:hypothetical protein